MKLAHARPKLALFSALAAALAHQDHAQAEKEGLLATSADMAQRNTSHGGRGAFGFDRRRAHLKAMKYRRAHG
jgi:hypothetical protein